MHDVHRESLIYKKEKKVKTTSHRHDHSDHLDHHHHDHEDTHEHADVSDHIHEHGHDYHEHGHDHHEQDHGHHHHDHETPHGHAHDHDESAYTGHDRDTHLPGADHKHRREGFEDRAYSHVHEHGHNFFHSHHHSHHAEHTTLTHKVLKDPARDWFGAGLMALLIAAGYFRWLPGHLAEGMIVCAAVIGIFPVVKNALFESIAKRSPNIELLAGSALVIGLFLGHFLAVALIAFFLLLGSFMRLNFSWRNE
jgi:cation transport ATPase